MGDSITAGDYCTESRAMRTSWHHKKSNVDRWCQLYCHRMKIQKFKIAILLLNQSLISAVPWGPKTALTGEFLYTESSAMRTSSHHKKSNVDRWCSYIVIVWKNPGRIQGESRENPGRIQEESRKNPGRIQGELLHTIRNLMWIDGVSYIVIVWKQTISSSRVNE